MLSSINTLKRAKHSSKLVCFLVLGPENRYPTPGSPIAKNNSSKTLDAGEVEILDIEREVQSESNNH